jgi:adenylate cyclase
MTAGQWTFAFAVLAGFTALTEAHGDEVAASNVARFYDMARESLLGSTQLVKGTGDAVLLAADEPQDGVWSVTDLMKAVEKEDNFPLVRPGLHTGTGVRSQDDRGAVDYVGSGVNVAARVAGHATCGQVLLTHTVAEGLDTALWALRRPGNAQFQNVAKPIELFELILEDGPAGETDPVCRMRVSPGSVVGTVRHGEHDYVFCSLECVATFAARPEDYVRSGGAP